MQFEYDKRKNEENIRKHKVSFEEVASLWADEDLLVVHAKKLGEKRHLAIGRLFGVLYTVVFTIRQDRIRIISARRSNDRERMLYEQNCDH